MSVRLVFAFCMLNFTRDAFWGSIIIENDSASTYFESGRRAAKSITLNTYTAMFFSGYAGGGGQGFGRNVLYR